MKAGVRNWARTRAAGLVSVLGVVGLLRVLPVGAAEPPLSGPEGACESEQKIADQRSVDLAQAREAGASDVQQRLSMKLFAQNALLECQLQGHQRFLSEVSRWVRPKGPGFRDALLEVRALTRLHNELLEAAKLQPGRPATAELLLEELAQLRADRDEDAQALAVARVRLAEREQSLAQAMVEIGRALELQREVRELRAQLAGYRTQPVSPVVPVTAPAPNEVVAAPERTAPRVESPPCPTRMPGAARHLRGRSGAPAACERAAR